MYARSSKVFERIISKELRTLNENLVSKRKSLKELSQQKEPFVINKKGEKHFFERKELEKISQVIAKYEHQDLKIPIIFYRDINLDSFYVIGRVEREVVKKLLEFNAKAIKGKFYIPKPLAYKILREFRTTIQVVWMF